MPLQKPRGRKQVSHRRLYASIVVLALLGAASLTYAYLNGYIPGTKPVTTGSTTTSGCPPLPSSTNGNVFVCIDTTMGSFEVELFSSATPKTVANFVSLTESGFYNNLCWHRIEPNFVIQTGDPNTVKCGGDRSTWGQGTSGTTIPFENDSSLHNYEGYLGMASTAPGTGGSSQFYINLGNNTNLDGKYAVFGKVIGNGMSVVHAIGSVQVETVGGQSEPVAPVYIIKATVLNP